MEITITINGKPVKATVPDEEMRKALDEEKKPEKKTGYERVEIGKSYSADGITSACTQRCVEVDDSIDRANFARANYYSDHSVAEANKRADTLMRQLRRFAAEHGGAVSPKTATSIERGGEGGFAFFMADGQLRMYRVERPDFGTVVFNSESAAESAIEAFHDELMWYFTEYDPMPEGWWAE